MSRYEYLDEMAQACAMKAAQQTDERLKTFYTNAAHGFEIRRDAMTVTEAEIEARR